MKVDQNTTFTQIYNQMKPGLLSKEDKHIRGSGNDLYTHNALMPHGKGAQALADRQQKYSDGAATIKNAIASQYNSPELADRVFQNLNLTDRVTVGDLRAIKREIQAELLNQPTVQAQKSDLSQFGSEPTTAAHQVFRGGTPDLAHASQAFREFLAKNHEEPTVQFLDAYNQLLANSSKAGADAFVRNHIDNPDMNIYANNKEDAREGVAALGNNPSRQDVERAFDHAIRDLNESFVHDMFGRFQKEYQAS
jgi:hypothetical protein